jgi:mannitol 2-dehydrogenase
MADQLARLGRRGSSKVPNYLLPSARSAIEQDRPHTLLCVAVAGWMRYLRGEDYAGAEVPIEGPRPELVPVAQDAGSDAGPLLGDEALFSELGSDPRFAGCVQDALTALEEKGPREVLAERLGLERAGAA